jgi:hypothetical protein
MENRNDIALQQKLDKQQYASQELIEVRVPVTLPYMNDWSQFDHTKEKQPSTVTITDT